MNKDNHQTSTPNWDDRTKEPYYMGDLIKAIPECIEACLEAGFLRTIRIGWRSVNPSRIFLIGCGTSYNACELIAYTCRKALKIPADVYDALDFELDTPFGVDLQALVISISHSGQTLATCLATEKAKSSGCVYGGHFGQPKFPIDKECELRIGGSPSSRNTPKGKNPQLSQFDFIRHAGSDYDQSPPTPPGRNSSFRVKKWLKPFARIWANGK